MRSRGRYETWIGGFFRHETPVNRPFLTPRRAVIAAASIATWCLVLVLEPVPPALRLPAGAALVVALLGGLIVWLRTWSITIERAHAQLLPRADLGDARRIAAFFSVFVGYGIGSLIVAGCALWLLTR